MNTQQPKEDEKPCPFRFLRRVLQGLFCANVNKNQSMTDDQIRESIGGTSATSSYQKPDKRKLS